MKQIHSPAKKRLETLQFFYKYCCETYKNKLEGNDDLLQQVYKIIATKIHNENYLTLFYGTFRNNEIYLKMLKDFTTFSIIHSGIKRNWRIRQTSMAIIKLINEKL